jgi:hypothetical protein
MNTTSNLSSYFGLGKQTRSIFKPLMTACDTLQSLNNGQKAIVSVTGKIRVELVKTSQNLINGSLWAKGSKVSSYISDPEIVSGYIDNDLHKLNIGGN